MSGIPGLTNLLNGVSLVARQIQREKGGDRPVYPEHKAGHHDDTSSLLMCTTFERRKISWCAV
jgi:hypothetical protein